MAQFKTLTIEGSSMVPNGEYVRKEDYAALQQKLDAVMAENARMLSDYREIPEMRRIGAPLTPATDNILNEVRAEGVDMYAQSLRRKQEDAFTESEYRHTKLGRAAVSAEKFAAQLRASSTEGGV